MGLEAVRTSMYRSGNVQTVTQISSPFINKAIGDDPIGPWPHQNLPYSIQAEQPVLTNWLSFGNFFRGTKSIVMLIFLLFSDQILGESKSLGGGQTA